MPNFTYDPESARYRNSDTGRYSSPQQIRGALDTYMQNVRQERVQPLVQGMVDGKVTIQQFQTQMQTIIKDTHIAASALAKGGTTQMTQSDWGRVGATVKEEYKYVRALAIGLEDGSVKLDGRLLRRAESYVEAGRTSYEKVALQEAAVIGRNEGRRMLQPGSHSCDDCISFADMGWIPLEEVVPIGEETVCGRFCNCLIETRAA